MTVSPGWICETPSNTQIKNLFTSGLIQEIIGKKRKAPSFAQKTALKKKSPSSRRGVRGDLTRHTSILDAFRLVGICTEAFVQVGFVI